MRRLFVSLAFLAFAGISEAADRRESSCRTDVECTGTPTLPETLVAPTATPTGPVLALGVAPDGVTVSLADPAALSKLAPHVFLLDGRISEKYSAFHESLTTP